MLTAVVHLHFVLISYGWCCKEEGRLLKLYVDVIKEEQGRAVTQNENEVSDERCYSSIAVIMFAGIPFSLQDLSEALYQCYRCLYGFPLKTDKGKVH